MNFYNDNDPRVCAWIRELINSGLVGDGVVSERSISDVSPEELAGFRRVHLFAGIGGWEYALRLAGWPDELPVWTGSCPCQPFSVAGRGLGTDDHRHLWPEMFRLVRECRPPVVFGEQVAGAAGLRWLDGVFADLESEGYACGAAVIGAHSVGAPHIRQRLYWVANDILPGLEGHAGNVADGCEPGRVGTIKAGSVTEGCDAGWNGGDRWHYCRDGKYRRIPLEPALFPLADGIPGRVGLLRGAGNAIVPQVAAEFIRSVMEVLHV